MFVAVTIMGLSLLHTK